MNFETNNMNEEIYRVKGRPVASLLKDKMPRKDLIKIQQQLMFLNKEELDEYIMWLLQKRDEME